MKKVFLCAVSLLLLCGIAFALGVNTDQPAKQTQSILSEPVISPANSIAKEVDNPQEDEQLLARRGCCSHHGGVSGCDEASGMMRCRDGSLSPSCTCAGY